jgi:hypothetical protein
LATGISLEPTTSNIQTPSFSFLRRTPQKEAISLDNPLEQLVQASTQDTSFLGNFSSKKLAFQPCFNPPAAPTKHRDHSLWSLDRKQEIVDDFREEQVRRMVFWGGGTT